MSINKKRSQSQVTPVEAADALAPTDAAVASAANEVDIDDVMERFSPTKQKKTETTLHGTIQC